MVEIKHVEGHKSLEDATEARDIEDAWKHSTQAVNRDPHIAENEQEEHQQHQADMLMLEAQVGEESRGKHEEEGL